MGQTHLKCAVATTLHLPVRWELGTESQSRKHLVSKREEEILRVCLHTQSWLAWLSLWPPCATSCPEPGPSGSGSLPSSPNSAVPVKIMRAEQREKSWSPLVFDLERKKSPAVLRHPQESGASSCPNTSISCRCFKTLEVLKKRTIYFGQKPAWRDQHISGLLSLLTSKLDFLVLPTSGWPGNKAAWQGSCHWQYQHAEGICLCTEKAPSGCSTAAPAEDAPPLLTYPTAVTGERRNAVLTLSSCIPTYMVIFSQGDFQKQGII